jgi:hypothetical protein
MDNYSRYILLLAIARSIHLVPCQDSTDIQAALVTGILAMREPRSSELDPKPQDAAQLVVALGTGLYGQSPTVFGIRDGELYHWADTLQEARSLMAGRAGTLQMQSVLGLYQNWGRTVSGDETTTSSADAATTDPPAVADEGAVLLVDGQHRERHHDLERP